MTWNGPGVLWALFLLQASCATFIAYEALFDILGIEHATGWRDSDAFEYMVAAALILGTVFTGFQLRKVLARHARMETQLEIAQGAFFQVLTKHFDDWTLTESERDVALLAVKGFSVADMARLRETKEGTVKAQCAAVYRKAGVSGRLQLLSLFIDELVGDPLVG